MPDLKIIYIKIADCQFPEKSGDGYCQDNNNIFVLQIISINNHLTGALASEGVVEGAVEEAGVRMVLFGATPCLAHLILCLCPVIGEKLNMTGPQDNCY